MCVCQFTASITSCAVNICRQGSSPCLCLAGCTGPEGASLWFQVVEHDVQAGAYQPSGLGATCIILHRTVLTVLRTVWLRGQRCLGLRLLAKHASCLPSLLWCAGGQVARSARSAHARAPRSPVCTVCRSGLPLGVLSAFRCLRLLAIVPRDVAESWLQGQLTACTGLAAPLQVVLLCP